MPASLADTGKASGSPSSRERANTVDSFNISSIESSKRRDRFEDETTSTKWQTATWVFSDILQSLSTKDRDDPRVAITKANQLVTLLSENPSLKQEVVIEHVVSKIQFMLSHPEPQFRCAAYRVLRHSTASYEAILHLVHQKILIFIIVSLSTPTPLLEKEEALKLVREFISIPNGANCISVGVVKALVALVGDEPFALDENTDHDKAPAHSSPSFMRMCIHTICEIAVSKHDIVFHGGGLRLMINLVINGSSDIAASCLLTLTTLLDLPQARLFLRNGFDLDSLIAVYSQFEDNEKENAPITKREYNRALKISFLLTVFLKTWTGLICFSHNNFDSLKNLLNNLRKRNNRVRNILLDLLLDVLRIKVLPWLEGSSIGEILENYSEYLNKSTLNGDEPGGEGKKQAGEKKAHAEKKSTLLFKFRPVTPRSFEHTIISHYQGLLLKIFFNCDLAKLLFELVNENRHEETTMKATYLLTHMFDLSANFLPQEFYNNHILRAYDARLTLPSMSRIEAATRMQQNQVDPRLNSEVKLALKEMTIQSRQKIDDTAFRTLISNTKVLTVKEVDEWNWNTLSHLFQGPLRDQRWFAELQEKYPKFLKTIFSFLRPFKYRFSNLPFHANAKFPKLKNPKKIILIVCQLIEALLSFEEGAKLLGSSKIMPQISEIFAQLDPYSGIVSDDPILSRRRLENTLSVGYIKIIGTLSTNRRGLRLLEQWQFFTIFDDIIGGSTEDESNNHLLFNLLNNLDYNLTSPTRLLFCKAMFVSNWKVKVFALEHIFPRLIADEQCENLAISVLNSLLYDASDVVVTMSVEALHNFFINDNNLSKLDLLIGFKPSISILLTSNEGRLLLLNFCRTTNGFRYLNQNGFIENCFLESIKRLQTFEYLDAIEVSLRIHFHPYLAMNPRTKLVYDRDLHHFFYYLLSTEDGFTFFNSKRQYVDELLTKIKSISRKLKIIESTKDSEASSNNEAVLETRGSDSLGGEYDENPFHSSASLINRLGIVTPVAEGSSSDESEVTEKSVLQIPGAISEIEAVEHEDEFLLKKLKQYIWVAGEIASSRYGIQILDPVQSLSLGYEHEQIAETFRNIFQHANNWQLRGLAFYQLGKMAATVEGVEILDDLKWISLGVGDLQHPIPLAYPRAMQGGDFFNIEILNPYQEASYLTLFGQNEGGFTNFDLEEEVVIETYEELDEKILSLISFLNLDIASIKRKARKELIKIKGGNPQVFSNTSLFLKTIRLVDKGTFDYAARVLIFELFNTHKVLESLVKRDRKYSAARR